MELRQKGVEADLAGFRQVMLTMKWTTAADLDIAPVYEAKDGRQGLAYFGEVSEPYSFPYIHAFDDVFTLPRPSLKEGKNFFVLHQAV